MKRRITAIAGIVFIFLACSKDNIQTKPSIKLKSLSSNFVPSGGSLTVQLDFTDKEGDIKSDTVEIIKIRNNIWKTATVRDTLVLLTGDKVPNKNKGVIELRMEYQRYLISADDPRPPGSTVAQNDSLTMRFVLKDNASHVSDTLVVKDIVIERK